MLSPEVLVGAELPRSVLVTQKMCRGEMSKGALPVSDREGDEAHCTQVIRLCTCPHL